MVLSYMNTYQTKNKIENSIILPCLNEEKAIGLCLNKILDLREKLGDFEIIVVDNGSIDKSLDIIKSFQKNNSEIVIVSESKKGYGSAYLAGFKKARGKYIYIADSDNTYSFSELISFKEKLEKGADLVVGNRFSKKMHKESMSFSHRFIGNPILSLLVRIFFKVKIKDIHCGARAFSKEILNNLDLRCSGMEFASEMIIKASRLNLKIEEQAISYFPRLGESKLKSFRDGWRHLRFILLYSPLFLFVIPGLSLFLLGVIGFIIFYFFNPSIFNITFDYHPLFLFTALLLSGYQLLIFGSFSKIYAINHLGDYNKLFDKLFKKIRIETVAPFAFLLILISILIFVIVFIKWLSSDFAAFNEVENLLLALSLLVLGIETFFSAFMFSVLSIKKKD